MKDNFVITNLIKKLIKDFDTYLTNFPHKEIELKREIMNTSYDNNKRLDIQDKIISYIKYLDFLVNCCFEKKIINGKKYIRFGENLDYLLRHVLGWRKTSRA